MRLVRDITERGLNQGDTSFIHEVFAPDYVVHARDLPLSTGPAAFAGAVAFWRESFPDFTCHIDQLTADGDFVSNRFTTTGTNTGPLGPIPPTGRTFRVSGVDLHRVVDSVVVESWISDDMPRILMEIGVLPAPGAAR